MDEIEMMYTDTIFLIKKDGTRSAAARGLLGNGKIATPNTGLDIEDGDTDGTRFSEPDRE